MMDRIVLAGQAFRTLVALTETEQARGLMHQPWPPPIMCFPYERPRVQKFWMRNTQSPLDIVFCCDKKIIKIEAGRPLSEERVGPDEPADLVVELPSGMAAQLKLRDGENVQLIFSTSTLARKYALTLEKITATKK